MGIYDNLQSQQFVGGKQSNQPASGNVPLNPPVLQPMYFTVFNGEQKGPFSLVQMQQMAHLGQITPNNYVWTNGMSVWAAANTVPSLTSLFNASSPPNNV